jgi:hypothetical protein
MTSPDGRYLFLRAGNDSSVGPSWLYDVDASSWRELPAPPLRPGGHVSEGILTPRISYQWVGPTTLAVEGENFLAFEDVDAIGKLRYVVGGP